MVKVVRVLLLCAFFVSVCAPYLCAERPRAKRCLKSTGLHRAADDPAKFWGCVVGAPAGTVQKWIGTSGFIDSAGEYLAEVRVIKTNSEKLALLRQSEGSASCYRVSLLRNSGADWNEVWHGPEESCCGAYGCEPIARVNANSFSLEYRVCTQPKGDVAVDNCLRWESRKLLWDGKGFER